jgi:predicted MPP superfamily phosphohydrolase
MLVPMTKKPLLGIYAQLVFLALALLAGWAVWLEPDSLRWVEHPLMLRHWPAAQNGLRVAVITDLHAGAPFIDRAKIERIVATTNAAKPDLVLLLGDYLNSVLGGRFIAPEDTARWLSALSAPLGVFGVLGNHDHQFDTGRVRAAFTAAGIPLLDEQRRRITQGRFDFWLVGIADATTGKPDLRGLGKTATDMTPIIAFTHSPDVMPQLDASVSLLLAGHTHGGQVRLPFYGAVMTSSAFGKRYEIGHVVEQTDLYICPGIGTTGLPLRFLDPPEICLLTLSGTDPSTPP